MTNTRRASTRAVSREQVELKRQLITHDDVAWGLPWTATVRDGAGVRIMWHAKQRRAEEQKSRRSSGRRMSKPCV
eukprot:246807-Chlamydomonas_euryale.AAC.3